MSDLLIRGGRVVDPANGLDGLADVVIRGGQVVAVRPRGERVGAGRPADGDLWDLPVLDARGKVVVPGLIDPHVHLREPGQEWKETIETGLGAAAAGGFVAVACMPNTLPPLDDAARVAWVSRRGREVGLARLFVVGAITKELAGEELAPMGEMVEAGAVGFSDDGRPVMNGELMRAAIRYASHWDKPILDHCEDLHLSADGAMHLGQVSVRLGLRGYPAAAEEVQVARDVLLAAETGGRVHVLHVSTARGVDLVRWGKSIGARVTAEATPHHLTLTDQALADSPYDANLKMSPPLRTEVDRLAVLSGLADGTIDCLATDHAPHHADDKEVEFSLARNGIVGLETAVGLVLDRLVRPGHLSLAQLVERMSLGPARLLGLGDRGHLSPGAAGDVTVLDLEREWQVDARAFVSLGRNTPYHGWTLRGRAAATVVGGRVVARDGRLA